MKNAMKNHAFYPSLQALKKGTPPMATDSKLQFAFQRKNYILLLAGIGVIALGFILMAGGRSDDPNVFNGDALFSWRRITLAPLVVLIGFVVVGYAIMHKAKDTVPNPPVETRPEKKPARK
jgi:hypothetical protein